MATGSATTSGRKGSPNYPLDYKLQVAKASCEPDVSVAKLAQSHGLNANMVFKWRRQYRAGSLGAPRDEAIHLVPITVIAEAKAAEADKAAGSMSTPSTIEIELNGAKVRVMGMVDPQQLRLVLRCLMPA